MKRLVWMVSWLMGVAGQVLAVAPLAPESLDLAPWFTPLYEFYPRVSARCQKTGQRERVCASYGVLTDVGLQITPKEDWNTGVVLTLAKTHQSSFGLEKLEGMVRWQLMDDVVGDACSMAVGLTGYGHFSASRRDLSLFTPGMWGGEVHLAVGKEWSQEEVWLWRLWGLAACGLANEGSPWLEAVVVGEGNSGNGWQQGVFVLARQGLGRHHLATVGVRQCGLLDYTTVDVGARLAYRSDDGDMWSVSYQHRVMAHNAPGRINQVSMGYVYPFGL